MIKIPINGEPATIGNGGTIGFKAAKQEDVDAWHAAGVNNGGTTCEDPPGVRVNGKESSGAGIRVGQRCGRQLLHGLRAAAAACLRAARLGMLACGLAAHS